MNLHLVIAAQRAEIEALARNARTPGERDRVSNLRVVLRILIRELDYEA